MINGNPSTIDSLHPTHMYEYVVQYTASGQNIDKKMLETNKQFLEHMGTCAETPYTRFTDFILSFLHSNRLEECKRVHIRRNSV